MNGLGGQQFQMTPEMMQQIRMMMMQRAMSNPQASMAQAAQQNQMAQQQRPQGPNPMQQAAQMMMQQKAGAPPATGLQNPGMPAPTPQGPALGSQSGYKLGMPGGAGQGGYPLVGGGAMSGIGQQQLMEQLRARLMGGA